MRNVTSRRIIDLSVPLKNSIPSDPPKMRPRIDYFDHAAGAVEFEELFPGLKAADLPDAQGAAIEHISLTTHSGTHLDAPWHFHSTMDGGRRAITIDEVPLEWCIQPGVKLDLRHLPDGHVCSARDLEWALDRIGHKLQPLEIVLINTAAGAAFGEPDYLDRGCGMGREATLYLLEQGVRVAGTDGWSWDAPFSATRKRFEETRDPSIIWEGHKVGREVGYCHLEKLANLDKLPASNFTVICLPVKIAAASAGWTRAVALVDHADREA
jgi:kynurenine formamidase